VIVTFDGYIRFAIAVSRLQVYVVSVMMDVHFIIGSLRLLWSGRFRVGELGSDRVQPHEIEVS
jgi:hypothetical protein